MATTEANLEFGLFVPSLFHSVSPRVVHETLRRQRGRMYAYSDYLALLDSDTDPWPDCDVSGEIETKRYVYRQTEATRAGRQRL